jgi:hypothetical protein
LTKEKKMNATILNNILAQRIPPEQFQLHGLEVVFFDSDKNNKPCTAPNESSYNTPENRAIVEDVIANYDTLAAEYLAQIRVAKDAEVARQAAKAQAYVDNLPSWQAVSDAIDAATTIAALKVIVKKMARVVYWLAKDKAT